MRIGTGTNRKWAVSCICVYILLFLGMLLCNFLTHLCCDDYCYLFSYDTGERITNIFQIFGSMKAHAQSMNGRLEAHFFVQLFLMLPKAIFNVVNALFFALLIYLMCELAGHRRDSRYIFIQLGLFSAVWLLAPAFGQVFLWLDGSCNYLWSYVLGFAFLLPYARRFTDGKPLNGKGKRAFFLVLSAVMGAWSENASAAFVCAAVLLLFFSRVIFKEKLEKYEILGIVLACLGYLTLYLAPAEWANKSFGYAAESLASRFVIAVNKYWGFRPVLIVYIVSVVIGVSIGSDRKKIFLSLSLFAGSLLANFMMVLAAWYEDRSAVIAFLLLVAATAVMLGELLQTEYKVQVRSVLAVLFLFAGYALGDGLVDIYNTHALEQRNKQIILESKDNGIMDITLPVIYPETSYSALYGLRYLATDTANTWPNGSMAEYYGVDSILGQ